MKIFNYLISITTAILLSVGSTSAQTELCPVATYERSTGNVIIPCVTSEDLQLSLQLALTNPQGADPTGLYFKLVSSGLSTCQWAPGACATLNEQLYLVIPIEGINEGVKHVAGLQFYPTARQGFHCKGFIGNMISTT